jgi:hypothetical protein
LFHFFFSRNHPQNHLRRHHRRPNCFARFQTKKQRTKEKNDHHLSKKNDSKKIFDFSDEEEEQEEASKSRRNTNSSEKTCVISFTSARGKILWQEIVFLKGNATTHGERRRETFRRPQSSSARPSRFACCTRATTFRRVYFLWIKSAPFDDAKKNFFQRDYYESLAERCGRIL